MSTYTPWGAIVIVIAETQARQTSAPSGAPSQPTNPLSDGTGYHAFAVLAVSQPGSTEGLRDAVFPLQRGTLLVLLPTWAWWVRGLVNPSYMHLLEVENSEPRTLDVDGHTVGVVVHRAWLTAEGTDINVTAIGGARACATCHTRARSGASGGRTMTAPTLALNPIAYHAESTTRSRIGDNVGPPQSHAR